MARLSETGYCKYLHLILLISLLSGYGACIPAAGIEPVTSRSGMVVAGHPEAAQIGAAILENGGNAIDAVVATAFALGVAEPYGSGIGGKCAIVYYEASSGRVWYVDGLDESGKHLNTGEFVNAGSAAREQGAVGVGVPGMVAALDLAHGNWGSLPWNDLLQPAIRLARTGFEIVPGMEVFFTSRIERIQSNPECARIYMPGGRVPAEGSRLSNPDLAATMETIAREGRDGFYGGTVAKGIVEALRQDGSHLTVEDFRQYRARMQQPYSMDWNGYTVVTGGQPTTGGATAALCLKVLEGMDWPDPERLHTPANLDQWGRVLRHVYPLIQDNMADTDDATERWNRISGAQSVERLQKDAGAETAAAWMQEPPEPVLAHADGWTTHFVVADKSGNVASVTQSLSHHFGSGVVVPGTGIVLNNSLKNFSYSDPNEVNYVAPAKRPRSTIAPAIVLRHGCPVLAIGLPGGGRIPTTLSAILIDHLEFGSNLGDAIAARRFHLLRSWSTEPDSRVFQMETGADPQLIKGLAACGWDVQEIEDAEFFGGVTAIEIGHDGILTGWADNRRTNHAAAVKEE